MKESKWKYILFCFHPKFDTKSWTIASAFITTVLFGGFFLFVLSLSVPACLCKDIFQLFDILAKIVPILIPIYVSVLLGLLLLLGFNVLCIYGAFKDISWPVVPFLATMFFVMGGTLAGTILVFGQLSAIDQYALFGNDTYWNLAQKVLKEDFLLNLEGIWEGINIFLKNFLQIDSGKDLNIYTLLDAILKDDILVILGASKRILKIISVLILLGMNWLFITSFIVSFAHWRKLKVQATKYGNGCLCIGKKNRKSKIRENMLLMSGGHRDEAVVNHT